ncbi:MAG: DUF6629 family protein [Sphingomicrobium sp.]
MKRSAPQRCPGLKATSRDGSLPAFVPRLRQGGAMCFSATASFTAAAALLGIGTLTIRRSRRAAEIPFASIPALFGIQQLVEGGLWRTFTDQAPHLNSILTHLYSLFSHVLWPIFVPIAVLLLEPVPWRRNALKALVLAGSLSGIYLLYFWVMDATTSRVVGHHIFYDSPHFYIAPILFLYVLGTCVSSLVSSHAAVRLFGVATLAAFAAAYGFSFWFISVWCFFAAVMSATIWLYFRHQRAPRTSASQVNSRA